MVRAEPCNDPGFERAFRPLTRGSTRQSCAEAPQMMETDFTESSEFRVDFEEQSGWTRTGNLEDTYI